jgi:hypothetical protein
VALGVPKDTSDEALEEAEGVVALLVTAIANIMDDESMLSDEYPDKEEAPAHPPTSPRLA